MLNNNQLNQAQLNQSNPPITNPTRTKRGYPKTGQNLIVWKPIGEITKNSTSTVFPP